MIASVPADVSTIELRRASDSEVPAVAELMNVAYGGTGPVAGWTDVSGFLKGDRTSAAALRVELTASPNAELLIVRSDTGALRASVWLEPRYSALWYLGSLTVDPREQKTGLGGRVLQAAERRILDQGGGGVLIDVLNVRGPLIAWYERRGYRLTGESLPYPYQDNRYGVPQRPDLCFLMLEKSLRSEGL